MAINLPRPRYDLTLISTSELCRLLNVPETRMLRAIREGVIRPSGSLGSATVIVMTKQDLKNWRVHFSHSEPQPLAKRPLKVSLNRSSLGNHRKPVISGVTRRKVNVKLRGLLYIEKGLFGG